MAASTATASVVARRDIPERLGLPQPAVVIGGFGGLNPRLIVERHLDKENKRSAMVDGVASLPGPGLLYPAARKDAESYAESLRDKGIAVAFHLALLSTGPKTWEWRTFSPRRVGTSRCSARCPAWWIRPSHAETSSRRRVSLLSYFASTRTTRVVTATGVWRPTASGPQC